MTSDEKQWNEIQQGERWFHEVCPPAEAPDNDAIKQRVRIALGEQWLNEQLTDDTPDALREKIRRRVHAAVSRKMPRRAVHLRWSIGVGALAAACAFALIGVFRSDSASAQDDFPYVTAFEQYIYEDVDLSLEELQSDVYGLALGRTMFAMDGDFAADTFDDLLDDIEEALEPDGEGGASWMQDDNTESGA